MRLTRVERVPSVVRSSPSTPQRHLDSSTSSDPEAKPHSATYHGIILSNMPKAVIELSEHANRVVNIVKAKEGLTGKSQAIERIVEEYEQNILDPTLRPEFVRTVEEARKGPFRRADSMGDLLK